MSLSVGGPRRVGWDGETVRTPIYKTTTDRRSPVSALGIEGDKRSVLTVHGGIEKAVGSYPSGHDPRGDRPPNPVATRLRLTP